MDKKKLQTWIIETATKLHNMGYLVIPSLQNKPLVKFGELESSHPLDHDSWLKADMVSIVLNDLLFIDYDLNHADEGEEVITWDKLSKKLDIVGAPFAQHNKELSSIHVVLQLPPKHKKLKQNDHSNYINRVDFKTGKQLLHVKMGKVLNLPAVSELAIAPKKAFKALKFKKKKTSTGGEGSNRNTPATTKAIEKSLRLINPNCSGNAWRKIVWALADYFDWSESGLRMAINFSRGIYFKKKKVKSFEGEEEVEEVYYRNQGKERDGKKANIETIHFYANNKIEAGLCEGAPREKKKKQKKTKQPTMENFPSNPYKGAPELAKLMFKEFLERSSTPVPQFAYMAVESTLQFLVGNRPLTPMKHRTTSLPMVGAGISAGGKDNNTTVLMGQLKREIHKKASKVGDDGICNQINGLGMKEGGHSSPKSFLRRITDGGLKMWISTEASAMFRVLSDNNLGGHGGAALALSLNELYDGHEISGKHLAKDSTKSVSYPHIPICWLTQTDTFASTINRELLDNGFLGRMEYFFDYENRLEHSNFTKLNKTKPFSDKLIDMVTDFLKANSSTEHVEIDITDEALNALAAWEHKSYVNIPMEDSLKKFLARIGMSAEKRLSYYAYLEGRDVIDVKHVQDMVVMMDYQVAMRKHLYHFHLNERGCTDEILDCLNDLSHRLGKKVPWSDFLKKFQGKYGKTYPQLRFSKSLRAEIISLAEGNILVFENKNRGSYFVVELRKDRKGRRE